jgi:hypothetical protein
MGIAGLALFQRCGVVKGGHIGGFWARACMLVCMYMWIQGFRAFIG